MVGFGQAERDAAFPRKAAIDEFVLLFGCAPLVEHRDEGEIADDGMLVLQIVVEAEAALREPVADNGHPKVRPILATILFRCREAPVSRLVGAAGRFLQQGLPFLVRQTVPVPVGACILPAMIEEAVVVVLVLERLDLGLDETFEFGVVVFQILRDGEIHGGQSFPVHRLRATASEGYLGMSAASFSMASCRNLSIRGASISRLPLNRS